MLASIFHSCAPRPEILSGELNVDLFAAKLRLVVEGKAPQVYQDANTFFANTFPTDGIKTLITEVFTRLEKKGSGSPVIRLETSFGGGKTHDEIALWHICKKGRAIEGIDRFAPLDILPVTAIQVAAIDGRDLDPLNGIYHEDSGITTYTLWGEIAYQIGGIEGYQLLQNSDIQGISPGSQVLQRLTHNKPTLIVLDEIARYLSAARAKSIQDSTLAKQVISFLFTLMDLAASVDNLVFVYSLASSSDTFASETIELNELIQASARQERVLRPSTDVEIYNIVKQRLFSAVSTDDAFLAAKEYLKLYRTSNINLPDACKDSQYHQAIAQSYPFHPELFSLLTKKIASIREFQQTRGALRLFAQIIRKLWQKPDIWIPLIHVHHIPVGVDEEVTNDLTSRIQRSAMRNAIGADIYNPTGREAYAQVQDQEWEIANKPPFSSWVARTIFLHSLTQGISSGIRRAELNLALLTPGIDIGFVEKALERLVAVAWYLDDDPITSLSRFREEPSINKIITEEKEQIGRTQVKEDLRNRRDTIFAKKHFLLVSSPESPTDVDDKAEENVLCLIDFDEATVTSSTDSPPHLVTQIFHNTGESGKFRIYRNRLLFLVANKTEFDRAIEIAREYKAIQNIIASQTRFEDLSESQRKQLKERGGVKDLDVRIALTNAYRHLFYPSNDQVKAPTGLLHYVLPSQDASTIKGKNNQQDLILKALKDSRKIRPEEEAKAFAPVYILQKVWPKGIDHWTTKALRDTFYKDTNLNMLIDAEISLLRDTIRKGLEQGDWDLKLGEKVYIKTGNTPLTLPPNIEFSEKMELYRRGILTPPAPKVIELSAQVTNTNTEAKSVRLRWKAIGALFVSLYQGDSLIPGSFLPSDEYQTGITQDTKFKLLADYGNGQTETKEAIAKIPQVIGTKERTNLYSTEEERSLLDYQPDTLQANGTINTSFNSLADQLSDFKVKAINSLDLTVVEVMDYRKILTSSALLNRYSVTVDQTVTATSASGQFLRLEYQGDFRGFQPFSNAVNALLNTPDTQANVKLTLKFEFKQGLPPQELPTLKQIFERNPVDKVYLNTNVNY